MSSFSDYGLLSTIIKTLNEKRLFKPTEIQEHTIPLMMSKQSVVGVAETGSGKTLAYALPLLHMLKSLENAGEGVETPAAPRAVVMVPTRELGEQVSKVFKTLTHDTRLRIRPALGGMAFEQARRNISGPFEVLLATPGRLVQLMQRNLIQLNDVRMLVFDEADQMLEQGFLPDSNLIVSACPPDLQLALFSATVSVPVQELINNLFAQAEIIRTRGSGKVVSQLTTKNIIVADGQRWPHFERILAQRSEGGTIVFTNTREQCDNLAQEITAKGYLCAIYRGEMENNERRANLKQFREGKIDMLIATDLGGRGLDIENVGRVINFHLPKQTENYLHRAGRTARAGRHGLVINLVTPRDEHLMTKLGISLPPAPKHLAPPKFTAKTSEKSKAGTKDHGKKASSGKSSQRPGGKSAQAKSDNKTSRPFSAKPAHKTKVVGHSGKKTGRH